MLRPGVLAALGVGLLAGHVAAQPEPTTFNLNPPSVRQVIQLAPPPTLAPLPGPGGPPVAPQFAPPFVESATVPPPEEAVAGDELPRSAPPPELLGDLPPLPRFFNLQPYDARPNNGPVNAVLPGLRLFKIADNESPLPMDRTYVTAYYYNDLYADYNERLGNQVQHINATYTTFGFEKTIWCGRASIGVRLPVNTLSTETAVASLDGTHTSFGDMTFIYKQRLWGDGEGAALTGGLALTVPTGPDAFAGVGPLNTFHAFTFQPFVGYLWQNGRWLFQGFSAIDVPTDGRDVTMLYNDLSLGFYALQCRGRFLSRVMPIVEVHVNTPLNHRGAPSLTDVAAVPDFVDMTAGFRLELFDRAQFMFGGSVPVTGPHLMEYELLSQFRVLF